MPAWINTGFKEFNKRLPKEFLLNLVEVQPVTRGKSSSAEKIMMEESKRIRTNIPEGCLIVALDEHGKQLDSVSLSKKLGSWMRDGRDVAFIIGGADGLADDIKNSADMLWSLSSLTLPHSLVRVVLVEQIYRAWTIMNNHPYHRE
jgi:23S rRNA (pseudouridine1915-N3)-methyltransferase